MDKVMEPIFVKDLFVMQIRSGAVGRVAEVDSRHGLIRVDYITPIPRKKWYNYMNDATLMQTLMPMTSEQYADFRLSQEEHGITNDWLE